MKINQFHLERTERMQAVLAPTHAVLAAMQGVAILAITLILFTLTISLCFLSVKVLQLNHQLQTHTVATEQAKTAAQSGLDYAIVNLQKNYDDIVDQSTVSKTFADGSQYLATYEFQDGNRLLINVASTGTSADGTATRQIAQLVKGKALVSAIPTIPLKVKSLVTLTDSARVVNLENNQTIASGSSTMALNGSAKTQLSSGISSSAGNISTDIALGVANLSNASPAALTQQTFGATILGLSAYAGTNYSNDVDHAYDGVLDGVIGKTIFITQTNNSRAKLNEGNTVVGSNNHPVTLIVDGKVAIEDGVVFYGNIIATGAIEIKGNSKIYGCVYSESNVMMEDSAELHGGSIVGGTFTGNNDMVVTYDATVLNTTLMGTIYYAKVPGTWRDF